MTASHSKVSHSFKLRSDDACYQLQIESEVPLSSLSLRSDIGLDVLDASTDENNAGVEYVRSCNGRGSASTTATASTAVPVKGSGVPADDLTFNWRFTEATKRFVVNLRTVEGETGNLCVFVVPKAEPKIAHLINLGVKPLGLHEKVDIN